MLLLISKCMRKDVQEDGRDMCYMLWGICKTHRVYLLQKCNFYTFEISEITFYVTGLFFSILTHLLLLCVCVHMFICMCSYACGDTGTCMCVHIEVHVHLCL